MTWRSGSWRALWAALLGSAALELTATIAWPVSSKFQIVGTLLSLAVYLRFQLALFTQLTGILDVRPLLYKTCTYVNGVLGPRVPSDSGWRPLVQCTPGSEKAFLLFVYLQLGAVLPVMLSLIRERSRKVIFLRQMLSSGGLSAAQQSGASHLLVAHAGRVATGGLSVLPWLWAWLSVTWTLLGVVTVLLAGEQVERAAS